MKSILSLGRLILSLVITILFGSAFAAWLDAKFVNPPVFEAVFKKFSDVAAEVTARMPRVHGAPVCIGEPEKIGIHHLERPDFGDMVTVKEGEIPVFWPCGVTPQSVVMNTCPPFAITHAPGHMLIADVKNSDLMD